MMDKITRILEYVYGNLDVFNPLTEYIFHVHVADYNLTSEEYISMILSFDFNTQGYYKRRLWRKQ